MPFSTVIESLQTPPEIMLSEERKIDLDTLADEVLLNILSYLCQNELHGTAARVCKKWLRLSRDPSLMKKLTFKDDSFGKTEHLVDMLSNASMLEELKIRCRDDATILVQTVAQFSCKKLGHLQINYCPALTEECTSILAKNCINLKSVNLDGTGTISDLATSNLMQLKLLRKIDLFNCRYVIPEHITAIANNCDYLEEINLGEVTHLNDECISTLLQMRKSTLRSLVLDGEDLNECAFTNLSHCDNLTEFNLSFAENLGSPVLKEISRLKKLKRLRYSRGTKLTKEDFLTAFSGANLSGLISVDFSECVGFEDEGLTAVAKTCNNLEQLTVDWCHDLTDDGIIFLIKNCSQINYLKLIGLYNITDAVLDNLITSLPKLKYLNLIQCPAITDDILHGMSLENLSLDIFDYSGNQVRAREYGTDEVHFSC